MSRMISNVRGSIPAMVVAIAVVMGLSARVSAGGGVLIASGGAVVAGGGAVIAVAVPFQDDAPPGPGAGDVAGQIDDAIVKSGDVDSILDDTPEPTPTEAAPSGIDLLTLIMRGGAFMIPIGLMSLLVVVLAIERLLALRRRRILPPELVEQLRGLATPIDRFSPTSAHRVLDNHRTSPTSRVVAAMLTRTGQPQSDVERVATESIQREADRAAGPIRWLSLAAAATPLMGLLGTVWGMIVAFHESTTLSADRSRSEQLSEGIYTALVTTLAGLAVAIPAAILALYLENRLLKIFHRLEEFASSLAPGLGRFTGRQRLDDRGQLQPITGDAAATASASTDTTVIAPPPTVAGNSVTPPPVATSQ